jgi:hypothetical protein
MARLFENSYFADNSLEVLGSDFGFINDLNGHFLVCGEVHGQMDLSERAFANVLTCVFKPVPSRYLPITLAPSGSFDGEGRADSTWAIGALTGDFMII